jgi:electron transfer flavoprotein beta subunit
MKLPAVLTLIKEINNPRLPTLKGKLKAKEIKIPIWGPKNIDAQDECLGLKGSPTRVVKIFAQKISREGEKFIAKDEDDLNKAIDKIMDYLILKGLI